MLKINIEQLDFDTLLKLHRLVNGELFKRTWWLLLVVGAVLIAALFLLNRR